jgi:hypothetical protein
MCHCVATNTNPREFDICVVRDRGTCIWHAPRVKGVEDMFGLIAAVLVVLWLLGFFGFHVSSGLIHVLLVIGIVMVFLHFFRGKAAAT